MTNLSVELLPVSALLDHYQNTLLLLDRVLPDIGESAENREALELLNQPIPSLHNHAFLYKCTSCGELKITAERLTGDDLLHVCDRPALLQQDRLSKLCHASESVLTVPLGRLELIATGQLDGLLKWAHSLCLGLDNPFKGI